MMRMMAIYKRLLVMTVMIHNRQTIHYHQLLHNMMSTYVVQMMLIIYI